MLQSRQLLIFTLEILIYTGYLVKTSLSANADPGSNLINRVTVRGSVQFPGTSGNSNHLREKRFAFHQSMLPIYNCKRESCTDYQCKPEEYVGPHPPNWCLNSKPHSKETQCSWEQSCGYNGCQTESTRCRQDYEDRSNGWATKRTTYNIECFTRRNVCNVQACQGFDHCQQPKRISMEEFNKKVKTLPDCNEVERKGRKRRDFGFEGLRRVKRQAGIFEALKGYCCDIGERFSGVVIANVRPINNYKGN